MFFIQVCISANIDSYPKQPFVFTGSTEATSDKVDVLCGKNGVFATAKLMGIDIKTDQKVIEVIDKKENIVEPPHLNFASSLIPNVTHLVRKNHIV